MTHMHMTWIAVLFLGVCSATALPPPNWIATCDGPGSSPPGPGPTMWSSVNGMNWTLGVSQPFNGAIPKAVAFSPNQQRWVVTGRGAQSVFFSDDGLAWTGATPADIFLAGFGGLAIGFSEQQNRWVVGGGGGTVIWYSPNGSNWTAASISASVFVSVQGIAYSAVQDRWVAVGDDGGAQLGSSVAVSSDGINWVGVGPAKMFNPTRSVGSDVVFASVQNMWVATGGPDTPFQSVYTSVDGFNWTAVDQYLFDQFGSGVYEGGRPAVVIAVGQSILVQLISVFRATNVTNGWAPAIDGAPPGGNCITYSPRDQLWVMGAQSQSPNQGISFSADDGFSWSYASGLTSSGCTSVAFRSDPVTILSGGLSSGIFNSSFVPSGVSITVAGNLTIQGDLTVVGSVSVGNTSSLLVTGNLVVAGQLVVSQGSVVAVEGTLGIAQSSVLSVIVGAGTSSPTVSVTVATFDNGSSGTFGSVLASAPDSSCPVSGAQQEFTSTSISVLVQLTCSGLTAGQIAGIAVGSVCGVILLVLALIFLGRYLMRKSDDRANATLRQKDLSEVSRV